jgi:hypothetical protein
LLPEILKKIIECKVREMVTQTVIFNEHPMLVSVIFTYIANCDITHITLIEFHIICGHFCNKITHYNSLQLKKINKVENCIVAHEKSR